jgi:hypothetical protein
MWSSLYWYFGQNFNFKLELSSAFIFCGIHKYKVSSICLSLVIFGLAVICIQCSGIK